MDVLYFIIMNNYCAQILTKIEIFCFQTGYSRINYNLKCYIGNYVQDNNIWFINTMKIIHIKYKKTGYRYGKDNGDW